MYLLFRRLNTSGARGLGRQLADGKLFRLVPGLDLEHAMERGP